MNSDRNDIKSPAQQFKEAVDAFVKSLPENKWSAKTNWRTKWKDLEKIFNDNEQKGELLSSYHDDSDQSKSEKKGTAFTRLFVLIKTIESALSKAEDPKEQIQELSTQKNDLNRQLTELSAHSHANSIGLFEHKSKLADAAWNFQHEFNSICESYLSKKPGNVNSG